MRRDVRRWVAGVRSLDRVRLAVYPLVGILAVVTVGARAHWFAGSRSGPGAAQPITLQGETAQREPIWVTVNRQGQIQALNTHLSGRCDGGSSYRVEWSPNSPRVRFVPETAGVFAREAKVSRTPDGVRSTIVVSTIAHVRDHPTATGAPEGRDRTISGDLEYHAVFHDPAGRVKRCRSGYVHWVAGSGRLPTAGLHFGGWAGYVWRGRVRTVGGAWSVPEIDRSSTPGIAATWIGAQAPARRPGGEGQFIQVGLNEEVGEGVGVPPYYDYWAFWTDTAHRFMPIRLFTVSPGDQIAARLTLRNRRWIVSIRDATSGRRSSFSTHDDATASFNEAEWLQENPYADYLGDDEYLYPQLSTVVMRHLTVDSAAPAVRGLESQWMSEDGGILGPSAVHRDSFSLVPVTLSRAGRRYLEIADQANDGLSEVFATLSFSSLAVKPLSASSRRRVADAQATAITALRAYPWPRDVQRLITIHIGELRVLEALTRRSLVASGDRPAPLGLRWSGEDRAAALTSRAIRAALHLPLISSAG